MPDMLPVQVAPTPPPGPKDQAPAASGKETQGPPFNDVLKDHQARTADAEGPDKPAGDDTPKDKTTTDPAATPATAAAQALALTLVAPQAPATAPLPAGSEAPAGAQAAAPVATAPTAAVLAAVAEATAGVPGEAASTDAKTDGKAGAIALPGAAKAADAKAAATQAAATQAAATPVAPAAAPATNAAPQDQAQPTTTAAATAAADAPAEAKPQPAAPATAQTQTQLQTQAPIHAGGPEVAQTQPPAPAQTNAPSPLNTAQAVERIQAMVHLAHARGSAQARIELHPAELGGVTIQLHLAHDGLRAHIAADRPDALPLLQRAATDLQRSLESRGIDLSGLDFGLAPDAEAGASRDDGRAQQRQGAFGGPGRLGADDEVDAIDAVSTTTRSVELPAGALVDVLA